ncbi:aryl hydrocarbon receptor-like [Stegostoma tigrinum]|uniref:aryl hydrocarbon receptor-like n=1 Tax=Stegostoma tigrinum TaxID=3053191 RepID=UPI002870A3A7|nr:aryl hydrocarbon receptor-like [Stegostoma tigrinum]
MSSQTLGLNGALKGTSSRPGLCNMIASTRNIFVGRKRKTVAPNPESSEQETGNAAKSNPSKRHRDRLNVEFDNLLRLLPTSEDVAGRLDKLSILRLSVSCLRLKRFFEATLGQRKRCPPAEQANNARLDWQLPNQGNIILSEGELLLQALNGFVLVVTTEGDIFYASPTIQEYVGFHQTAVMHQPVYELLHPEDRDEFQRQLHWALDLVPRSNMAQSDSSTNGDIVTRYDPQQLPPENSPFLERNFVCKMRSLLNSPSGYMALNMKGKLKYLYGQNKRAEDGSLLPPQLALFAIATPLQMPSIVEIRTRSALFQTKHKLDFSPVACDAKAKSVLGYSELELCMRGSGYQFIHADDMLYCADNHVQLMKTGQSGMTIFRLLTKHNVWIWVQANAYLVYKNGQPDFIIAKQRLLTDKEGMDHFQKRTMPFPLPFLTGDAVLYDHSSPILGLANSFLLESSNSGVQQSRDVDPNSLFGAMMSQDKAVYIRSPATEPKYSLSWIGGRVGLGGSVLCSQNEEKSVEAEESSFKQDDDLLSLLNDMLQSDNEEVFTGFPNVMESLGPEDLELMHWVESTLTVEAVSEGSLTNDQVLSYVQESFKKKELDPCPLNGLQPNLGTGGQLAQHSDTTASKGSPWMPPTSGQLNAPPLMPRPPSKPSCLTHRPVPPCSLAHRMQCSQQSTQWPRSTQRPPPMPSPPPTQHRAHCKQQPTRQGYAKLPQHSQHAHWKAFGQQCSQQSDWCLQQPGDPNPSPVSGLNPGYARAPQGSRADLQQNIPLHHLPPNPPNSAACGDPSQRSRLDFSHQGLALTSYGQETQSATSWFPSENQPNATPFPLLSSSTPHGKSANVSVFHSASTVPLCHEYMHLHPVDQNGWHPVELYKTKQDPNGLLSFHSAMNSTPIFGNGSTQ